MQVLNSSTVHELQALAMRVLHDPSKIRELTAEQLIDITEELANVRISILADVCKHESKSQQ